MRARYQHQQKTPTGLTVLHDYEHSAPMTEWQREEAYYRQNRATRATQRLTLRQERAFRKAHRRAVARASALLAKS